MEFLKTPLLILVVLFLIDQLALWMERKGWLYWRHRKRNPSGGVGNALQELNSLMNSSNRHVVEAKKEVKKSRRRAGAEDSN